MANNKESGEVLELVLDAIEAVVKSTEDGKVSYTDLFNFWETATDIPAAFKDINVVATELKDPEAVADLVERFKGRFTLPNKESEALVEEIIEWLVKGISIVEKLV